MPVFLINSIPFDWGKLPTKLRSSSSPFFNVLMYTHRDLHNNGKSTYLSLNVYS
ncbi:hypothetical protein DAPPUDRAFT_240702 [Daphnia pulex]|uniref:Uncharacterized protein n=1 Tax=Daphnia pulex TaxID=6669 RepID=E9GCA7_DAPPU|nr:hypothetical protein DAPPUDRAFT_240702 [Daphnia pulex]|eukprot:EFX82891.1 hypothetical protein DAPPUDRAFT_240702 [Daphnia pulex]